MVVTAPVVGLTLLVSVFAGGTGAMLGVGGGSFLVPILVLAGLPFRVAVATSLVMIIATSSAVAVDNVGRGAINLRLGMVLEVATTVGGLAGGLTALMLSTTTLQVLFAVVLLAIALMMILRLGTREATLDESADPGRLGGRFFDEAHGAIHTYRVHRMPLALGAALLAGNISGLLGIGGGMVKVPMLVTYCGVPIRAAAATSAFMLGVTAVSSVVIYYAHGDVVPALAAAAVLGAQIGTRAGLAVGTRASGTRLRLVMIAMLFILAGLMLASIAR